MNKIFLICIVLLSMLVCSPIHQEKPPKLVIGIVVDQMRYDYLTRYWDALSSNGFKRFYQEGFVAHNHHFNYYQTLTGPGHASISTGTTPSVHGIIGNEWYDRTSQQQIYCVDDKDVEGLGSTIKGRKSPKHLITTTFADQLRLHTQFRNKVIGVSLKDRSAVLSTGHSANAAYWFAGGDEGVFTTSTHYMDSLPNWVSEYNAKKYPHQYALSVWNTLRPIEIYTASGPDDTPYEGIFKGAERPTFPYDLSTLSPDYYKDKGLDIVRNTPFGNTMVTDMALLALAHEDLGKDEETDVLMISYSSTDHIGHQFGLTSIETQDTYLRLDLELERLFSEIDQMIGMDHVTLFLTSDHGAVHVPKYLNDHKFPGGHDKSKGIKDQVNQVLFSKTGVNNLVLHIGNDQMYLDHQRITKNRLDLDELTDEAIRVILTFSTIEKAFKTVDVPKLSPSEKLHNLLIRGNHVKRAGDIYMIPKPGHIDYGHTGTTHGTGFSYDTHAPLLMMGHGIKAGHTYEKTSITDIAPTMCALLGTAFPNGMTGNVISKALLKADK